MLLYRAIHSINPVRSSKIPRDIQNGLPKTYLQNSNRTVVRSFFWGSNESRVENKQYAPEEQKRIVTKETETATDPSSEDPKDKIALPPIPPVPFRERGSFTNASTNALRQIENLIGRKKFKKYVKQLTSQLKMYKKRIDFGMNALEYPLTNLVFIGNPGSGKKTAALYLSEHLKELKILQNGLYLLHQAGTEGILNTLDGMVMINDINALLDYNSRTQIQQLLLLMDRYQNNILIVLSGTAEQVNKLFKMYPDLTYKFPVRIPFPDFTMTEIAQLIAQMAAQRGFQLTEGLNEKLPDLFAQKTTALDISKGNAAVVAQEILSKAIARQSIRIEQGLENRVYKQNWHLFRNLTEEDFGIKYEKQQTIEQIFEELDGLVGLENVKQFVRNIHASVSMRQIRQEKGLKIINYGSLHMIFTGNPGTGKTSVAKIIGKILKKLKVLKRGHFIDAKKRDLVAEYVGQTSHRTTEVFYSAMGGILFIDEAYQLNDQYYGFEALTTVLHLMEEHRDDVVVIMAGYPNEMESLLDVNPGLRSRFPNIVHFPDYSIPELLTISVRMFKDADYTLSPAALRNLDQYIGIFAKNPKFGNARDIRNVVEKTITNHNLRLVWKKNATPTELTTIEEQDIPAANTIL